MEKISPITPENLNKLSEDKIDEFLHPVVSKDLQSDTSYAGISIGDEVKTLDGEGGKVVYINSKSKTPFKVQISGGYECSYTASEVTLLSK